MSNNTETKLGIPEKIATQNLQRMLNRELSSQGSGQTFRRLIPIFLNWDVVFGGAVSLALLLQKFEIAIPIALAAILRRILARALQRIEEKLGDRAVAVVDWIFDSLGDASRWLWWRWPIRFQARYCRSLVHQTCHLNTSGPTRGFTFPLEDMYVSLKVSAKAVARIPPKPIRSGRKVRHPEVWDFLAAGKEYDTYQQIAILGKPGAGKTTLMKHLALTYAKNQQRRQRRNAPKLLPILLYVRDIREHILSGKHRPDLVALIENQDWIQAIEPPPHWFKMRLRRQQCLVLIDGLDEVANEAELKQMSRWIDRQIAIYPGNRFLISSRQFGYNSGWLQSVGAVLEVRPFGFKQTEQFIQNWYLQCELRNCPGQKDPGIRTRAAMAAGDLIARIKNHPPIMAMADNPLLVNMIVRVHGEENILPKSRAELYAEACRVLLRQRKEERDLPETIDLTAAQKLLLLQKLALALMQAKKIEFSSRWAEEAIQQDLVNLARDRSLQVKDFLKLVENTSGLLFESKSGTYEFSHRSLQEYLASLRIKELNRQELLLRNLEQQWWSETIRLYAAQADATNIITMAFMKATRSQQGNAVVFKLAYDCLEECPNLRLEFRAKFQAWIDESLQSSNSRLNRYAAEVKLLQRFEQLVPFDEVTKLDPTYITCGEYQLFIDEKAALGEYRQPDRWPSRQYLPAMAQQPVTGVRASDAEAFCHWLTDRYLHPGLRYRLPTLLEEEEAVEARLITSDEFGCWCQDRGQYAIAGLTAESLQRWRETARRIVRTDRLIARQFHRKLVRAHRVVSDLACAEKRELPHQLESTVYLSFKTGMFDPLGIDLSHASALVSSLRRTQAIIQAIIRGHQLAKYYELKQAHQLTEDLSGLLQGIPLPELSHVQDLATEAVKSFGRKGHPDRNRIYGIVREIAAQLADHLCLIRVHTEARIRDLEYILDRIPELDPAIDLDFAREIGLALACDLDWAHQHKRHFRSRTARTADDIGRSYLYDASSIDNIKTSFKIACSRSQPHLWKPNRLRSYLLIGSAFWHSLGQFYSTVQNHQQQRSISGQWQTLGQHCAIRRQQTAQVYTLVALLEQQFKAQNLSWGGIRIVRETLPD